MQKQPKELRSPWLNRNLDSLLNTELRRCEDYKSDPTLRLNDAINWIFQRGFEADLREELADKAPLIRIESTSSETWISQPISGAGNTVVIAIGFDTPGGLRVAGSNWCSQPERLSYSTTNDLPFFEQFDLCADDYERSALLQRALNTCLNNKNERDIGETHRSCRIFRAMPIHVIVLSNKAPLLATFPAVVHGAHFCDFSLERVTGARQ